MDSRLTSLPLHCREERDKAFEEAFSPLRKVSFRIRGSRTEMTGLYFFFRLCGTPSARPISRNSSVKRLPSR